MMKTDEIKRILKDIAQDAADDASAFDGKPFNGRTMGEYLGNHGASIAALARILEATIDEIEMLKAKPESCS